MAIQERADELRVGDTKAFNAMKNGTTSVSDSLFADKSHKWAKNFDFESKDYTDYLGGIGGLPKPLRGGPNDPKWKTTPRLGGVELDDLRSSVDKWGTGFDPDEGTDASWYNRYRKDLGLKTSPNQPSFKEIENMRMIDMQQIDVDAVSKKNQDISGKY